MTTPSYLPARAGPGPGTLSPELSELILDLQPMRTVNNTYGN
jgi:hypothetical protein